VFSHLGVLEKAVDLGEDDIVGHDVILHRGGGVDLHALDDLEQVAPGNHGRGALGHGPGLGHVHGVGRRRADANRGD